MSTKKSKIDTAKLAALSKEEKLKLWDLIQKKKELQKERREAFKPNSAQLPVVMDDHKIRFFAGGNGCWAPGTKIRMYDGTTKQVEHIIVGDILMGQIRSLEKYLNCMRALRKCSK